MNADADVSGNTWVVNEDDMSSDLDTKVPTQQSVKAYVDGQTPLELTASPSGDLTASGITTTMTVDANTVGVTSALHLDTDGNYIEADANAAATMPCMALALETGTGSKQVLLSGFIRNDAWAWTVGGEVYVSDTVGTLTQTAPSGSGDQVQRVGIATHADRLYFNPDLTVIEIA